MQISTYPHAEISNCVVVSRLLSLELALEFCAIDARLLSKLVALPLKVVLLSTRLLGRLARLLQASFVELDAFLDVVAGLKNSARSLHLDHAFALGFMPLLPLVIYLKLKKKIL